METRDDILRYAGYSAYITANALGIGDSGPLTAQRCRWLVREFNNNWDGMPKKWTRLFSSLNKRLRVKVEDFFTIEWDERKVQSFCEELAENRRLMMSLRKAVYDYKMDYAAIAERFGLNAKQLDDLLRRGVWPSEDLLKAIRNSLPLDEGFPGRFQISIGEVDI